MHRFEGDRLSIQCNYKGHKNHIDDKVWCKIRRKKCELGFTRPWVSGPSYLLQDDVKAKVITVTMMTLRRQDSGRYWCMRNSSGTLYPLTGFQLEVSPGKQTSLAQGGLCGTMGIYYVTTVAVHLVYQHHL